MSEKRSGLIPGLILSVLGGAASAFIIYCEKLQFIPSGSRTFIGTLGLAFLSSALLFTLLFALIRGPFSAAEGKKRIPILLSALILSVCLLVWFPVPQSGLYPEHSLEIRALSGEDGAFQPVTLTWLHRENGDIPLNSAACTGTCDFGEYGPTLTGSGGLISWRGKTGDRITVEFVSGIGQGTAEIRWDDAVRTVSLANEELERLSFDFSFPAAVTLPELIADWFVSILLSLFFITAAAELLPKLSPGKLWLIAFVCFVTFRVCQFLTAEEALFFIDSESYLGMSKMTVSGILRGTQYCHEQYWYCIARPFFIPLVYKLCRQDPQTVTAVQLIVSILSWGFFAWHAAALCRSDKGKKAVLILSFGLGCIPNVTRWDAVIMSESLSLSAALLLMGSLFWLTAPSPEKKWRPLPALCTALSALLYAQSRDSAVWAVVLIAVLLPCISFCRSNRKVIFILCAALAAVCWYSVSTTGGRWQYPFENVLFNRILRDPQGEAFFIKSGMPMPARIRELYGVEHMMGSELFNSDEMAPLREWIDSEGLKTYIRYLLSDPVPALRQPWYSGFEKEAFEQIGYTFSPKGFRSLMPDPFIRFFSCNLPGILIIGAALLGIFAAFRGPDGERWAFPLLFVLSAYILCIGVFLADEYEFARHSMIILLMMKASAWPILIMLAEPLD